jgi:hypothetical protein
VGCAYPRQDSKLDFDVDFETWPPSKKAVDILAREFPDLQVHEPDSDFAGDIQFHLYALVTYELVMRVENELTELMAPFGGRCESWGVLHEPPSH